MTTVVRAEAPWTAAQYQSLGTLVVRNAPYQSLLIEKEVAGRAMLATFTWEDGASITIGIEPDGYAHS